MFDQLQNTEPLKNALLWELCKHTHADGDDYHAQVTRLWSQDKHNESKHIDAETFIVEL